MLWKLVERLDDRYHKDHYITGSFWCDLLDWHYGVDIKTLLKERYRRAKTWCVRIAD